MVIAATPGKQLLLTGGTGFIGAPLVTALRQQGHTLLILTRQQQLQQASDQQVCYINSLDVIKSSEQIYAIVNLAGESLAAKRWNEQQKNILIESRLQTTQKLFALAQRLHQKPQVLINASAIGYYGPQAEQKLDEEAAPVNSFSHRLCQQWEAAAQQFTSLGTRVCMLRFGVVLGPGGGPFAELRKSFDFGVASQFGSGEQWLSWVHRDDVIGAILFTLEQNDIDGPVNATAPEPVTNKQFCAAMRQQKRTFLTVNIPAFALRAMLGEMAEELLLTGQRVIPKKLTEHGYNFKYARLSAALRNLLER